MDLYDAIRNYQSSQTVATALLKTVICTELNCAGFAQVDSCAVVFAHSQKIILCVYIDRDDGEPRGNLVTGEINLTCDTDVDKDTVVICV